MSNQLDNGSRRPRRTPPPFAAASPITHALPDLSVYLYVDDTFKIHLVPSGAARDAASALANSNTILD
eukprot:9061899-Pyramimonas_sp.AAC.1